MISVKFAKTVGIKQIGQIKQIIIIIIVSDGIIFDQICPNFGFVFIETEPYKPLKCPK